jgi:integrase
MVYVKRQVRLIDGHAVLSLPKGGKQRSLPLPESVGLRLSAHIQQFAELPVKLPWTTVDGDPVTANLLFTAPRGGALRRTTFNKVWTAARSSVGLDGREHGMHVLRHTAASAWLAAGVDIRTVAEFLGHSDPGFTLRVYAHLMPDATDRARRGMDAFFTGSSAPDVQRGAQ